MNLRQRIIDALESRSSKLEDWPRPTIEDFSDIVYPIFADFVRWKGVVFSSEVNKSIGRVFGNEYPIAPLVKLTAELGEEYDVRTTTLREALKANFGEYDRVSYSTNTANVTLSAVIFYDSPQRLQAYLKDRVKPKTQIVLDCSF